MKKKILVVDDSALMRRVLCDIINSDDRFEVSDYAIDGVEGFKKIVSKEFDAVVLDVYMPRMTGIDLLRELKKSNVSANIMMASTTTKEGAKETLDALSLGAIDFIQKPENAFETRNKQFQERFLSILETVADSSYGRKARNTVILPERNQDLISTRTYKPVSGKKIVAIASSTGGPKALQDVIPKLPANLNSPVLLVQHMPKGFTKTLADRLDAESMIKVSEACEGEYIENGHVYVAPGGQHLKLVKKLNGYMITLSDEPPREGVKPCANYMYESLIDTDFDEVVCCVLTGMGADGTAGIKALSDKKKVFIVAQDENSATVYGMPKAIAKTGLCNSIVDLSEVPGQIIKNVGVR